MKRISFILLLFIAVQTNFAQNFPSDPDSTQLVTSDIDQFWKAFEMMENGYEGNPFDEHYVKIGSQGVIDFIPYRIEHPDTLFNGVKRNKAEYLSRKENTLKVAEQKKQIQAAFYAFKYWYPDAIYPPVYFVIGNFNSGGTSSKNGLIIGAEMQQDINNVPIIVAHELIHFQQGRYSDEPNLLEQSLHEGMADFMGELISGSHINTAAHDYARDHKDELCSEFIAKMDADNWDDWLYGTTGKDDRPNDLGYWIGYEITKAYYEKKTDKHQAIRYLLAEKDAREILEESEYLREYMN